VIRLTDATGSATVAARSAVKSVDVNRDDFALGQFDRR
jgi:hypothetical protein